MIRERNKGGIEQKELLDRGGEQEKEVGQMPFLGCCWKAMVE